MPWRTKNTARSLCFFAHFCEWLGLQPSFDVVPLRVFLHAMMRGWWSAPYESGNGFLANPASTYFALLILTSSLAHQPFSQANANGLRLSSFTWPRHHTHTKFLGHNLVKFMVPSTSKMHQQDNLTLFSSASQGYGVFCPDFLTREQIKVGNYGLRCVLKPRITSLSAARLADYRNL